MNSTGLRSALRGHILALVLFPALSFIWVGDTLIPDYDLSAFDVIFRLPHWKVEHEYRGVQQLILSDSPQAHYPERAFKWRATRRGERIDFNPYIFSGVPDQSQGVGGFITSPFQLFTDIADALDWSSWFRLTVAGLFMYAFLVVLGLSSYSAILGGVLWAFNTGLLWFSYTLIGLGLFVCGWFFISGSRTPSAWLLMVSAVVLILYSSLELPSVRNDGLPERLERDVVLSGDT